MMKIQWIGPTGHTSAPFGPLIPGQWYEATPELAEYLCAANPEYWQPAGRQSAPSPPVVAADEESD